VPFRPLKTFWQMSWPNRFLIIESMCWLAMASFLISILSVKRLRYFASLPVRGTMPPAATRLKMIRQTRWAVLTCVRHTPWRAVCFQQGLAAQFMLRRRSVPSTMFYGAALESADKLKAHAWVRAADIDVIGCEISNRYTVVMTFSSESRFSSDRDRFPQIDTSRLPPL
jgi:Transglutaminase-like superfamily